VVNSEFQYKGKRDEYVGIICPNETIILGLEATTKSVSVLKGESVLIQKLYYDNSIPYYRALHIFRRTIIFGWRKILTKI